MLSSDKAKAREEGIKLLNTWLEGERSFGFCEYIGNNTATLKPNEIPHAETWPFIITLLTRCVSLEISSSKRRLPKINFAKTLRIVVQRAEDVKFFGKSLLLLSVAKLLFNHIWDVLMDVPSFQSEYGTILRHLLALRHYKFHMRKRVYGSLVLLYMEKVEKSLSSDDSGQSNTTEEIFRCIQTLQSLLENPPGDFPDNLQEDIVKGFVGIFSYARKDGKISRKLIECINTYLLKDGPNLGRQSLEIHYAVQQFVFHCWSTVQDRGVKDSLILYARLQLNLTRGAADGSDLLEQLLDVIGKELDQIHTSSTAALRSGTTRENKYGNLTTSQRGLVELAALVIYRACVNTSKAPVAGKRVKRVHAAVRLKDGLMKGKWLWNAAVCYIVSNYHTHISKDLFISWFEGICLNFERIINDATKEHAYDGLLWTLRASLQCCCRRLQKRVHQVYLSPQVRWKKVGIQYGAASCVVYQCSVMSPQ